MLKPRVPADLSQLYEGVPRVSRAALEAAFGTLLGRAIRSSGVTMTDAARELGIPRPHIYRYIADGDEDAEVRMPAAWLFRLPVPALRQLLDALLRPLGMLVVELPAARTDGEALDFLAELHRETSEAVSETLAVSLRHGTHWPRSSTSHLRRELLEAVSVLMAGVAICDEAEAAGAVHVGPRLVAEGER